MRLEEVWIKRSEGAEWELAVDVNEGSGPLIDRNGLVIYTSIWSARPAYGSVMVVQDRPLPQEKGEIAKVQP